MRSFSAREFVLALWLPLALCFAFAAPARGQTLASDLPDYPPGAIAVLTATGFAADESVRLQVVYANGAPNSGPHNDPWWVTADANGAFVTNWQVCEDDCVGQTFLATADGVASLLHAETMFTDANCGSFGAGIVASVVGNDAASCQDFTQSTGPNIANPDLFELKEGGSYTMTIDNVTECTGGAITVVVENLFIGGSFCFDASRVASTNTFAGSFSMPDPACAQYSIRYKCGAGGSCDATGTVLARGPTSTSTNCRTVRLRASHFDASCTRLGTDECCSYPSLAGVPPDVTVECDSVPAAPNVGASQACEQCFATPVMFSEVSTQGAPGTCAFTSYTITRTWIETDTCGNVTQAVQVITVVDTTPPTIGAPGANATIDCSATPSFTPPAGTDACGGTAILEEVSDVTTPGTCAGRFERKKTWRYVDACGNASPPVSQTITVQDTTPPLIGAPGANVTIDCSATPVFTAPTATDDCSGATVVLESDVTTSLDCTLAGHFKYERTQTWHAVDGCGNQSASVSQTIRAADVAPPSIGSPGASATIDCSATPVFTPPTAVDDCGDATVLLESDVTTNLDCSLPPHFKYERTKTWHAIDECGHPSASVSQTITVQDTTAPTIGAPGANSTIDCSATPVFTAPTATDDCGGATVVLESDVTTNLDCMFGGHVKYERKQTWHALDDCGNRSPSVSQTIKVADTTPPAIGAPGPDITIPCNATPVFTPPGATDDCSGATVLQDGTDVVTPGNCPSNYSVRRSWNAVDSCGNVSSSVSQTITVQDLTPPNLVCPPDILGVPAHEYCEMPVNLGTPTADDACGGAVTITNDAPATFPIGTTIVNWTAMDECGNSVACQQRVQVLGLICIAKFYDADADGIKDRNEHAIGGWKFVANNLTDGTTYFGYTGASGRLCLDVTEGSYSVTEVAPSANWVATTPPSFVAVNAGSCWVNVTFGNYCYRAPGDGFTINYWGGINGQRTLAAHDPQWRQIINVMNLRNADGSNFDVPLTGPARTAIGVLQTWLAGASETNMAYMLSAQLAATTLSAKYKNLGDDQLIIIPGGVKSQTNVCIVPLLSTNQAVACGFPLLDLTTIPGSTACSCSSNDAIVYIGSIRDRADCLLGAYASTTGAGMPRTYQECVKDLLDMVNVNGNPGPPSAYPCGGLTQYVNPGPGACPFPPNY